jgi:hemolysin activation/secretion protein
MIAGRTEMISPAPRLVGVAALAIACGNLAADPMRPERERERAPAAIFDLSASQSKLSDWPGNPNNNNVTVRLAATMTKSLERDWMVRASVNTQYNSGDLTLQDALAPPAFTSLRMMRDRDVVRDGGIGSNLELYSPNMCASFLRKCRALMFYDRNYIRYNRNYAGQLRSGRVGSVGVGVRMQMGKRSSMQFDYGRVVRSDQMPDDARNRLTLRMGYAW